MQAKSASAVPGPSPTPPDPELFRRLVQGVTDYAIFALDATGHVRTWNQGAHRIKGYTAAEIHGRHFSTFYLDEDRNAGKPERLLAIAAEEGHVIDEGWRVRKDGTRFWASVVITALRNDDGTLAGFTKITRDLTEQRETEEAARRSEENFRLLVESVTDYAILILDLEGRVTSWNRGAERIKGWTAEEILGRSFIAFYPPEAVASGFPQHELEVATREGRFEDEGWRLRRDGSRFWANVIISALRDAQGRPVGFAKVTRDLTVRREAEEQRARLAAEQAAHAEAARRSAELAELNEQLALQAAELEEQTDELKTLMEQLEESNVELEQSLEEAQTARDEAERAASALADAYRELDKFAYVASHDLKAPLRGIANLAEWIREDAGDALPPESREHMRLLQGRVHRMEALIDGILTYSRAGRLREAPQPVDIGGLLAEVIELIAPPPGVQIELSPGLPTVEADRVPLLQVFLNLIGNAVKYGTPHRPDLRVRVDWRDAGEAWEFTVTDNGPGIAPEYHDRIWAIFQTLEARDKVEGTGIGLSVVKKVVEMRGGRVWLESEPGMGATFGFAWPKAFRFGGVS